MLIVLKTPSNPLVIVVVRLLITKLLAIPALVEIVLVETFEAVRILVLSVFVLRNAGTIVGGAVIPVKAEPSPTNFAVMVPAEIVEKKP